MASSSARRRAAAISCTLQGNAQERDLSCVLEPKQLRTFIGEWGVGNCVLHASYMCPLERAFIAYALLF